MAACVFVLLCVFTGVLSVLTTLAAGQFRCPALTLGQDYHFYNPDDCTKFYECAVTNEIPAVQDCSAPLVFNPTLNICDWDYNSPCGDGSTTLCTSAPCLNGGSCLISGATTYACSCPAGFSGENCQISSGGGNACSPSPCQNGGTCSLSGSSYSCSCPSGYTGTNCNGGVDPGIVQSGNCVNFTTECGTDSMTVEVEVEPGFMGKIYAHDHEDSCQFTNTSQDPTIYIYEFFHFNSSSYRECGQTFTTAENNSREFSATTIVQFNPSVLVASDLSHTSSCAFNNDISVRTQLGNINGSGINLAQSESSAEGRFSEFYRFGVSALDPEGNGAELSGSEEVTVGTRLKLFAMVLHNSIFSRMLLTNCVASSRANQTDEDYVSLQLLDHSGRRATDSVVEPLQLDGPLYTFDQKNFSHRSDLTLTSFMFVKGRTGNSNQLAFSCDVMLCPSDNTDPCAYVSEMVSVN